MPDSIARGNSLVWLRDLMTESENENPNQLDRRKTRETFGVQRWDYDCHCAGGLAVDHVGGHRKAPRATLIFLIVGVMASTKGSWGGSCQARAMPICRKFRMQQAFVDFKYKICKFKGRLLEVCSDKVLEAWGAAMAMCCGLIACFCTIFWPAVVAFWVSWQEWRVSMRQCPCSVPGSKWMTKHAVLELMWTPSSSFIMATKAAHVVVAVV